VEEIYQVITDFPIMINRFFRKFSKQPSTLVALKTYEVRRAIAPTYSGIVKKSSNKTVRYVWVVCLK